MPITPRLSSLIRTALADKALNQAEADEILAEAAKDGVTAEEVDAVVDSLAQALGDGMDLAVGERKKVLNQFLGQLENHRPLGLDEQGIERRPDGTVSYVDALLMRGSSGSVGPGGSDGLSQPTFSGQSLAVDDAGRIHLDGRAISLNVDTADGDQINALMGLLPKGQLDALPQAKKQELANSLLLALKEAGDFDGSDPLQFEKTQMMAASLGALSRLGAGLSESQVDGLLALFEKAPNPMCKSLILQALDVATLSPGQQSQRDGLEAPEHKDALLTEWNKVADGEGRAGYSDLEGPAAQVALAGLAYCKKPASIENLMDGISTFKDLNPGDWSKPFDTEETGHLTGLLKNYVTKHEGLSYTFGTWKNDSPKHLAKLTNARVAPDLKAALEGQPPRWGEVALSPQQAAFLKKFTGGVKDEQAIEQIQVALCEAAFVTNPEAGSSAPLPTQPLSGSAFAAFKRVATRFLDNQEGTADGMVDARAFSRAMRDESNELRSAFQPRLAELNATPPTWNGLALSSSAADTLLEMIAESSRSSMSAKNLGLALNLVAEKNGGAISSTEATGQLEDILISYMENWPDLSVYDFNKLERIAKFKVEGKDVPLCKLNGQELKLAEFYGKVGAAVTNSIDRSMVRHEWVAHRWGTRAKQSVELMDVIAENTAQGKGPVAELRSRYPGKTIEVRATGLDGEHQQFLFAVKDGNRTEGLFNQGSDGSLSRYRDRKDPVLFTAEINADGSFDVQVPSHNRFNKYPLQTTYAVGDSIDVAFYDSQAIEVRTEGEKFDTKYKNLEGKITGYDAAGNYQVKYTRPDGSEEEKTLSLTEIRKHNTPHFFKETGSYLRDVEIDIRDDQPLKDFLEGADPIIQRHLPIDGSLANMSAQEIAKRQKACIDELMDYADERMKYPRGKESSDPESRRYWELDDLHRYPLGELLKIGKGQCRHQCIVEHLLLQRAGIDSRLASGAANTGSGNYRGLHLWVEVTLADNARYLSDQTWKDEAIPLWDGAYDSDKRRIEIYKRTSDFDMRHVQ
jgi:hypothetical protein